jgi:hypothetical protein
MAKFRKIMEHLHPRIIIEKTEIPNDNARAGFTLQSSIVRNYSEFENKLISYTAYHTENVFGSAPPPEFSLDKARKFLEPSIGFDNAVFIALSGTDGGMPHVLNQINDGFKKEAKQAYFTYVVNTFIDPLSFNDTVELMRELKQKLGSYSPQSFGYIEPEAMASNYKDILWKYIESLTRYRNLWNY